MPGTLRSTPERQNLRSEYVNRFPVLVRHGTSNGHDTLVRLGTRRKDFENLAIQAQRVAWADRLWPRDLSAHADQPVRELYLVTADDTDDVEQHCTEICWPLRPVPT